MITITNNDNGKIFSLTEEQEVTFKTALKQFEAIAEASDATQATTTAYFISLAAKQFLDNISKANDNKTIEELLEIKEI